MMSMIAQGLGGLGLFLLGMVLMTDGLKSVAGGSLRTILTKTVRGPVSGIAAGTGVSALVQSSNATTIATIGFVSAGLIGFLPAVGVVLGSNIGTTSTGWLVAVLGMRYSIAPYAMMLVLVGAMILLLRIGRSAALGTAIAGFGLLFVGLGGMQEAMGGLAERIDPESLPGAGWGGRMVLLGAGFAMSIVTQSASAALAATLAALASGALNFEQSAALVIGQNVGAAVAAAIAAIGASVTAKRTAMAHVLFNVILGGLLIVSLRPFLDGMLWLFALVGLGPGVVALAAFNTFTRVIGVLLVLPVIGAYAALVERLIPERSASPTRFLDRSVGRVGSVASEAARRSAAETLREFLAALGAGRTRMAVDGAQTAAARIREFMAELSREGQNRSDVKRNLSTLHAIDHIERLAGNATAIESIPRSDRVSDVRDRYDKVKRIALEWLDDPSKPVPAKKLEALGKELAELRKTNRRKVLADAAEGELDSRAVAAYTEAVIHLDRSAFHIWRALHHLDPDTPEPVVDSEHRD
ncbi:MAG: Na/Pi cotransporter family protein [Phycisphaerales bacterium]|nr:MAG: Na/Pi cotransporter family protein [Phycisphaerales bacterium]